MRRFIAVTVTCLSAAGLGLAALAQEMPTTPAGFYKAGERFAHCSAHFSFAANLARQNELPDSATAFEGMERGWRVAGLILLTEGLDTSRQTEAEGIFATLQQVKMDQVKAWREVDPDGYSKSVTADFDQQCAPWVDLQKAIIAALRSGAGAR